MFFVLSFYSNISFLLNLFPFTNLINTALYLSNWMCFLCNIVLALYHPLHVVDIVEKIPIPFLQTIPLFWLHTLNQICHIIPLVLFKLRQTFAETFSTNSFLIAAVFFLTYLITFSERTIHNAYNIHTSSLFILVLSVAVFLWLSTKFVKIIL